METITRSSTPAKSLQMPIGYRFCPTDEEIVIHYLRPKVFSLPLPATAILHSDHLLLHHPSRLPGDPKEKRYFFHKPSYSNHASNPDGYWKPLIKNGSPHKLILATGCNHPIGLKKSFVFYQFSDHRRSGLRTPWILHQFSLVYPLPIKIQEWIVCCIHVKSKNVKNHHQVPAKKLKKSHYENDHVPVEVSISPVVIDDDSSSGITFNDDLGVRKEEEDDEISRVN